MTFRFPRRALLRGAAGTYITIAGISVADALSARPAHATTLATPESSSLPTTYYVSASGSDDNDGTTPQQPWATVQKANTSVAAGPNTILFRRGDEFYGQLVLPFGCGVGAYGDGAKPVLTMYKRLNRPTGWVEQSPQIWKIDLNAKGTHDGYIATSDANIGFLVVDGIVKAAMKFSLSDLTAPWDFFCDIENHTLFVKATQNPTSMANDIRAAPNGDSYGASSAIICCDKGSNYVRDIHITGTGGCGIRGVGADVQIQHCVIDFIGGSLLRGHASGTTRYGNGIENWPHAMRWLIEENEIAHVYDVAWSPQGTDRGGGEISWQDLTVRNNHIHDCGQSVELWSETSNANSPGFVRILFENNRCERAGYGAFADVRPDQDRRVHLLTYRLQTHVEITIQNNVFDDAYGAYSYHAFEPPAGYVTMNNLIRLKPGRKMEFQRSETVEQASAWIAATGREQGSDISILS